MKEKERQRRPASYKSETARANQLAGLSGVRVKDHVNVDVEKINGRGALAIATDEVRKRVIDMYQQGNATSAIVAATGLGEDVVSAIKTHALDTDSQFRESYYRHNLKAKLQRVADASLDRLTDLMPTMGGRDAAIAAGITMDKLLAMERSTPDIMHQHVHIHGAQDISKMFQDALKPKS
jgi:hypothetical protein